MALRRLVLSVTNTQVSLTPCDAQSSGARLSPSPASPFRWEAFQPSADRWRSSLPAPTQSLEHGSPLALTVRAPRAASVRPVAGAGRAPRPIVVAPRKARGQLFGPVAVRVPLPGAHTTVRPGLHGARQLGAGVAGLAIGGGLNLGIFRRLRGRLGTKQLGKLGSAAAGQLCE